MALLKIRIELQRPRRGIEIPKLAKLAEETQKFLRSVAEDVGIDPSQGIWVAQDFYEQGVGFDAEYQASDIDDPQVQAYEHVVDEIVSIGPEKNYTIRGVRPQTLIQSARMAMLAGEDEVLRIGLYNGRPAVTWKPLEKARAAAIVEHYQDWIEYRGMIQGIIHALYKEAQPPYFHIRDLASSELVKCVFQPSMYRDVYEALERKEAVVLVSGWIRTRRSDPTVRELKVERIKSTQPLSDAQLRAFFGSAPGWTGDLTTEEFIERARGSKDAE